MRGTGPSRSTFRPVVAVAATSSLAALLLAAAPAFAQTAGVGTDTRATTRT